MKKLYKVIASLLALILVAFGLREYTDYIKDYTLKHSNKDCNCNKTCEENNEYDMLVIKEGLYDKIKVIKYKSPLGYTIVYNNKLFTVTNKDNTDFYNSEGKAYFTVKKSNTIDLSSYKKEDNFYFKEYDNSYNNEYKVYEYVFTNNTNFYVMNVYYPINNYYEYLEGMQMEIEHYIRLFEIN